MKDTWHVKFSWPSTAIGYYTFMTEAEAEFFATLFSKKIQKDEETKTLTVE